MPCSPSRIGSMDVVTPLVALYLGALFIFSGLIVNLFQVFCFVAIRPFSKNLYRRINRVIVQLLWLQLIWLFDWWACVKLEIYADDQTFQAMGNENALVIPNHRGDMDWLVGWMLAQRSGCLGSTLAVMKKSSKFLPVIGWSMWFTEYLFLERSWTKDETALKSGMQRLNDFPCPFWVAFFVEGTRFTEGKLLASQEFAASKGMPIPRNVLIPRTKGFVATVNNMREFVPAVYDVTVVVPKVSAPPTMLSMLQGKTSVVHAYLKRHSMNELPLADEEIAQWCRERFIEKDALIDKHMFKGSFDEKDHRPTHRSTTSFLVVFGWSILFLASAVEIVIRFSIFSTWKGIAFTSGSLMLVAAIMHIFVLFSRAERAGLPKKSLSRQKAE